MKKRIQNRILFLLSILMFLTYLISCGSGSSKSTVAIVDGNKIPGAYFLYTQPPGFHNKDRIDQINTLEKFYRIQLRTHDARNIGVLEDDSLKYTILMRQEEAKMEALYQYFVIDEVITEDMIRETYENLDEKRTIRQILIAHENSVDPVNDRTPEEARELAVNIRKQLVNQEIGFAEAAAQYSDGPRAETGGVLGSFSYGQISDSEEFQRTAWNIDPHTISEPVDTQFGIHLIEVTRVDTLPLKSLEEERSRIKGMIVQNNRGLVNKRADEAMKIINEEEGFQFNQSVLENITQNIFRSYRQVQAADQDANLVGIAENIDYEPIGTMGGEEISRNMFMDVLRYAEYTIRRPYNSPSEMVGVIQGILQRKMFVNFAEKQNITEYKDTAFQLQSIEDRVLDNYYTNSVVLKDFPPGMDSLRAYFERVKYEKYAEPSELHVREIYVSEKDQAKTILEQIQNGANFAELAEKYTERPLARESGGDLGWFTSGRYGDISTYAMYMEPGEVEGPIQVGTGWSLIQLIEKRPGAVQDLEEIQTTVSRDFTRLYRPDLIQENIDALEEKYNAELNYDFLDTI